MVFSIIFIAFYFNNYMFHTKFVFSIAHLNAMIKYYESFGHIIVYNRLYCRKHPTNNYGRFHQNNPFNIQSVYEPSNLLLLQFKNCQLNQMLKWQHHDLIYLMIKFIKRLVFSLYHLIVYRHIINGWAIKQSPIKIYCLTLNWFSPKTWSSLCPPIIYPLWIKCANSASAKLSLSSIL